MAGRGRASIEADAGAEGAGEAGLAVGGAGDGVEVADGDGEGAGGGGTGEGDAHGDAEVEVGDFEGGFGLAGAAVTRQWPRMGRLLLRILARRKSAAARRMQSELRVRVMGLGIG